MTDTDRDHQVDTVIGSIIPARTDLPAGRETMLTDITGRGPLVAMVTDQVVASVKGQRLPLQAGQLHL